jgi:transposase
MNEKRKGYPSDVSDEEWGFCLNYLTLMKEDAPQREYSLRGVFNALRYLVRVGGPGVCCPMICRPGE